MARVASVVILLAAVVSLLFLTKKNATTATATASASAAASAIFEEDIKKQREPPENDDKDSINRNRGSIRGDGTAYFRKMGEVTLFIEEGVNAFFTLNILDVHQALLKVIHYINNITTNPHLPRDVIDELIDAGNKIDSAFQHLLRNNNNNNDDDTTSTTPTAENLHRQNNNNNKAAFPPPPEKLQHAQEYQILPTLSSEGARKRQNLDYIYQLDKPFQSFYSLEKFLNYTTTTTTIDGKAAATTTTTTISVGDEEKEKNNNKEALDFFFLVWRIKRVFIDAEKFINEIYQVLYENEIPSSLIFPSEYFFESLIRFANDTFFDPPFPLQRDYYHLYHLISTCQLFKNGNVLIFLVNVPIRALSVKEENEDYEDGQRRRLGGSSSSSSSSSTSPFYLYSITPLYYPYGNGIKTFVLKNNFFIYNFQTEHYLDLRDLSACKNIGNWRWFCKISTGVKKYSPSTASCEALLFRNDKRALGVCHYLIENRKMGLRMIRIGEKNKNDNIDCFISDEERMNEDNSIYRNCNNLKGSPAQIMPLADTKRIITSGLMVFCHNFDDGCYYSFKNRNNDYYQFLNPPHHAAKNNIIASGGGSDQYSSFKKFYFFYRDKAEEIEYQEDEEKGIGGGKKNETFDEERILLLEDYAPISNNDNDENKKEESCNGGVYHYYYYYWKMLYSGIGYLCLSLLFLLLLFSLIFYIFNQLYNPLSKKIWELKDDITEIQKLLVKLQQQQQQPRSLMSSNYSDNNSVVTTTTTTTTTPTGTGPYPINYRQSLFPTTATTTTSIIPFPLLPPPPTPPLVFSPSSSSSTKTKEPIITTTTTTPTTPTTMTMTTKTTTTTTTTSTNTTTTTTTIPIRPTMMTNKTKRRNQAQSLYLNVLSPINNNNNDINCSNEDEFGYVICNNNNMKSYPPPPHPPSSSFSSSSFK